MKKWIRFTYLYLFVLNYGLKLRFCLSKRMVFRDKSVTFVTSIPIPKAPISRGWQA